MNWLPKFSCISKMGKHLPTHDELQDHKKACIRLEDKTNEHHIQIKVLFAHPRKYSLKQQIR